MIKIAIVDDNSFLVKATQDKLSFFEDIEIKFSAQHGQEAIDKLALNPTVKLILMDIEMPIMNGIDATKVIKAKYPHIKIIILTVFENDDNIFNAIQAGADGYLLKEVNMNDLYRGIVDTNEGGATMTPSIAYKTLKLFRNPTSIGSQTPENAIQLTPREIEVLEQFSRGLKYGAIAENLFLSTGTVRKHVENIYLKLQAHNKLEAIEIAKRHKLI